jgi:hydroxyethylthiazole kinase
VTANDIANMLLACGASPIMSDEPADIAEITSLCSGLHINLGTLHVDSVAGMFRAGKTANALGHAVLLDPVGVGASCLRRETALALLKQIHFDAIRGNVSEMKTLVTGSGTSHGVDADVLGSRYGRESTADDRVRQTRGRASGQHCRHDRRP